MMQDHRHRAGCRGNVHGSHSKRDVRIERMNGDDRRIVSFHVIPRHLHDAFHLSFDEMYRIL